MGIRKGDLTSALSEWDNAIEAIEQLPDNCSSRQLDAASRKCHAAQKHYEGLKARYERQQELDEAKRGLPVAPVAAADGGDRPASRGARVTRDNGATYHFGAPHSFFQDGLNAQKGDRDARSRLERHVGDLVTDGLLPLDADARAIAETAGSGGELVGNAAP